MSADTPQHIVSIDLETLGTRPGDVVVTVGFVVLSLGGNVIHRETIGIDVASSLAAGMKIEASTLRWWMVEAPEAARRALFATPAIPLAEATLRIRQLARIWCRSPACRGVYGWGSVFDNALLHAAMRAGGLTEPAWDFRLDLCGRTLAKEWGIKAESDDPHVADADALAQGRAVLAAIAEQREALRKQAEADAERMPPAPRAAEPCHPGQVQGMALPGGVKTANRHAYTRPVPARHPSAEHLRVNLGDGLVGYRTPRTDGVMPAANPLDAVDRQCADVVAAAIVEAAGTPEVAAVGAALDTAVAAGARLAIDLCDDLPSETFDATGRYA